MFALLLTISLGSLPAMLDVPIDEAVLPGKTEIFIVLQRSINTSVAQQGDRFHARVDVPVTLDDQIIIPTDSYVLGEVDYAKRPGRVKGKALLRLIFDTVILPDGTTRKISAVVQSAEGQKQQPDQEEGTLTTPGSQGGEIGKTAAGTAATGAIVGAIAGRSWGSVGSGSAVGAASGAILALFKRGKHVIIPKGTSITVQLESAVRFSRPEITKGTPLKP